MERIILDAYNVIHKIPELSRSLGRSLEAARIALIDHMVRWRATSSFKGHIILVFDGRTGINHESGHSEKGIKIIFSDINSGEEADDKIAELLRSSHDNTKTIVISDDNRIANSSRAFKAKSLPTSYIKIAKNRTVYPRSQSASGAKTDASTASSITREQFKRFGIKPH